LSFSPLPERLVECVPNFSEGRDSRAIRAVVGAAAGTPGVRVLHIDSSPDAHRTVFTYAGAPEACLEAGFRMIRTAAGHINMQTHRGVHPRIGAVDVFPFVPLRNVTMAECADLARRLAERAGNELGIPAYLYGEAARSPERKSLSAIRTGGYEGLADRMQNPAGAPDFGPAAFRPDFGACAIGARGLLIAYNVNLADPDPARSRRIAEAIRESGATPRDGSGAGERIPGRFAACQAIGWRIESRGRTQVSTNLTDYRITPPHAVYEECVRLAAEAGTRVTGSEVVGLIPREALLTAGRYYSGTDGAAAGTQDVSNGELIRRAVAGLGLDDWTPFDPSRKILEACLAGANF
jgi:glutamate formiminotransferase/formiminotetrahydrofolate cyclodeaminase